MSIEQERIQVRRRKLIIDSLNSGDPLEVEEVDFEAARLAPRYPNGVDELETYGNTILLADAGIGKSMLSIGISLEAVASEDWSVAYFNAELDKHELSIRVKRYYMGMDVKPNLKFINWISAGDGTTIEQMAWMCVGNLLSDRKLLVVIDSIQSFAEFASNDMPNNDLTQTRRIYNWATQIRKKLLGDVSFLIVSETNAGGGVKGRKGAFSADVVVKIEKVDHPDIVEINVLKSRSGKPGSLGRYLRDWKNGRFTR